MVLSQFGFDGIHSSLPLTLDVAGDRLVILWTMLMTCTLATALSPSVDKDVLNLVNMDNEMTGILAAVTT
jgi:hypothetical protein